MPSPSGSTPIYGFPYLLETDAPDIATAQQSLATAVENEFQLVVPIGGVIDWYSAAAPAANWLFLHGQTVTGGAASFPKLATQYPSWVSGGNLVMPDTRDRFTMGAGGAHAVGTTGGSATTTLTSSHLPQITAALSLTDPGHNHSASPPQQFITGSFPTSTIYTNSGSNSDHSPAYNISATSTTTTSTTGITGSVTLGNVSPTGVAITPSFIAAHKIVRAA